MKLALVVHNHQPVDNDPEIIERIYRSSYRPFLNVLSAAPEVKATLHYTGYLLEWLEKLHPDFIASLARMVDRGQVEILGGGFYEPILSSIPDRDSNGQIALLRDKVRKLFGTDPHGIWTAERAWEPQMPEILERSGVRYTALDDTIFMRAGLTERECLHPYLVESRGSFVTAFPMSKRLRYLIPWKPPSETISALRSLMRAQMRVGGEEPLATFGDDGEKFGSWPGTYHEVYEEGWLSRFLKLVGESSDWLTTTTLSGYLGANSPRSRVYLPSASYEEMMTWATMPSANAWELRRPTAFWRGFLSKYPESARLYSKMLQVSNSVGELDGRDKSRAIRELWKGQSNDVYWHGVFGGLYSTDLRRIAYHHLIRAQSIVTGARARLVVGSRVTVTNGSDGVPEFQLDGASVAARVSPALGGSVPELSFKKPALQLFDVLARRRETYHEPEQRGGLDEPGPTTTAKKGNENERLAQEGYKHRTRTHRALVYDRYPKYSFTDFFLPEETSVRKFAEQGFGELARFAGHPYEAATVRRGLSAPALRLTRAVTEEDGPRSILFRVDKTIEVSERHPSMMVTYRLGLSSPHGGDSRKRFAVELNFGSLGDREISSSRKTISATQGRREEVLIWPRFKTKVVMRFSRPVEVWSVPIVTLSRSESGLERTFQGVSIVPTFLVDPHAADEFRISLSLLHPQAK